MKEPLPIDRQAHRRFWNTISSRRFPLQGTLELTRRCGLNCPYCYIGGDRDISPDREMDTGQILSLIDQVAAQGCLFLTFTGGEPLLREDFREIYLHALRRGILPAVFTSGVDLDESLARFFKEFPPLYLDITLPGVEKRVYERITGVRGSFSRAMEAIALCEKYGIPVRLKSVISRLNYHHYDKIRAFARRQGREYRFDPLICPRLDGGRQPMEYRLSPEEIVKHDQADEKHWEDLRDFACRRRGLPGSDRLYRCGGGDYSFHITSSGDLTICVLDTGFRYNLLAGSFREGWKRFIPEIKALPASPGSECLGCEISDLCGNCPAWSTLETGEPGNIVEFRCRIAHLRCRLIDKDYEKKAPRKISKTGTESH